MLLILLVTGALYRWTNNIFPIPLNQQYTVIFFLLGLMAIAIVTRSKRHQLIGKKTVLYLWLTLFLFLIGVEFYHFIIGNGLGINVIRGLIYSATGMILGRQFAESSTIRLQQGKNTITVALLLLLTVELILQNTFSKSFSSQFGYISVFWLALKIISRKFPIEYTYPETNWYDYLLFIAIIATALHNEIIGLLISAIFIPLLIMGALRTALMVMATIFGFIIYGDYYDFDIFDNISELIRLITFGFSVNDYVSEDYFAKNSGGQEISGYIRNKTNLLVVQEFFSNPVFGVGARNVKSISVFTYYTHTYAIFLLGAYGIFAIAIFWVQVTSFATGARFLDVMKLVGISLIITSFAGEYYLACSFLGAWLFASMKLTYTKSRSIQID